MKLSIGNLHVKDVVLGSADSFVDGVLTINKKAAIDYLMGEDDHITSLEIVIAHPGDDTRIVPVIETIEPRCRMDGRTLFPGVTGEVSPAGDGELKAFKGCCVTVVGGTYGSFGDGVIDMGGEGAKHTYWSKLINICLVGETDEEFERFEQQKCNHALRWAGHRFAEYIGKIAKDLEPEDTEEYVFDPIPSDEPGGVMDESAHGHNAGYTLLGRMFALGQVQGILATVDRELGLAYKQPGFFD